MSWEFYQPVKILFGTGGAKSVPSLLEGYGIRRPALVCGKSFLQSDAAESLMSRRSPTKLAGIFSDIQPNPTLMNVDICADFLRKNDVDGVIAAGGGSVLDCAKAATVLAVTDNNIKPYFDGKKSFTVGGLPLIALPTTAGTGSEVTCISVLTDMDKKAPVAAPWLYPRCAVVDPLLTLSVPKEVTAASGIDALSHALEALWSVHHRTACDALAIEAVGLILKNIEAAYSTPDNLEARAALSEGALLAGLSFSQTKTAGVHACSFPLTTRYGLSHGAACAFTLAAFTRLNADAEDGRLHRLSKRLGFQDAFALADEINRLNGALNLPRTLAQAGIPEEDIPSLAADCLHPNIKNNPVAMDANDIAALLLTLK